MVYIQTYIQEFYYLFIEMAPWLLFGFLFAGILHVYMPKGSVQKYMGGNNVKSVIYAALLGIPLPLCSCGVIPTGISFYKEGASKGSTVSFLISTPQTGVDSILATYSLLGLPFAILRPVVAFFSGILGGIITNTESVSATSENEKRAIKVEEKQGNKFKIMLTYAFYEFLMDIAKWLIIGLAIAALISMLLPTDFFTLYLDNEFLSMLIVLAASVPIYVCATGSIPIAAVLMLKGLSPGAALVFLMAGPATNAATMAVISKSIDRRTLIVYMITIIGSALIFGMFTNQFLPREWFTGFISQHDEHNHELIPYWLRLASGIILALLIAYGYFKKFSKKTKTPNILQMDENNSILKLKVKGMTCSHCKANVENKLSDFTEIDTVVADPDNNSVLINGNHLDKEKIKLTIEDLGYSFHGEIQN